MKKIVTVIFCLMGSIALKAQANSSNVNKIASPNAPKVEQAAVPEESLLLKENEFDFGKIPQGKPVTHIFEFTNTGNIPFALDNVQASCGCTTPEWNKDEIIQPGKTAIIKVGYNAAAPGPFNKTITVTYNGNQTKQLFIKGEVWNIPAESAPANTAIKSLN